MEEVECVVAGAGVVGLAIAREAARRGLETFVIEAEPIIGAGTSSRNSEVIHAGLYYPRGSLKARFCVEGRKRLYRYAEEMHVPHRRCGKLIVATDESQRAGLQKIRETAEAAGVTDLELLSDDAARALEPALSCVAALLSPSTGIIDSHALMMSLRADAEDSGAALAFNTEIVSARRRMDDGLVLATRDTTSGTHFEIAARTFINAAGLSANALAMAVEGTDRSKVPNLYLAKGNYFSAPARNVFSRLIYPVPQEGGLGVHLTMDLGGNMRFGPDVEWTDRIDYRVDPERCRDFFKEIRRYWPDLPDDCLQPAYSGIRPKLAPRGAPAADFAIHGPAIHGASGLVHLFGIESPGLTSCLAIAEYVMDLATLRS
ncbi:NAD(P)/FAD-dependent oxidoreductase [Sinorhizobium sp. BG8]|uniref:NAD(P)/FAD-dependent oxidoreductase n=1 Tax=Sinorhizobium sp. BG8 TaxID=2613773 RepID=UPI00193DEF06|nr:NAD(P)/FAD-dependent oxidoreductase [Sinorhizobium sp. BG8]QRM57421.1 NAD(P)/FAD-dependent oxidoreductase [Sinorhizobium sp. BG8]